jgi:hypothetical protein
VAGLPAVAKAISLWMSSVSVARIVSGLKAISSILFGRA